MADRIFGEIAGVPEGSQFHDRRTLAAAGVHRPLQAGISGGGNEGADSIVVSGGYEDDEDYGDVLIYTGHGGNDPNTRRQIAAQTLSVGNLALAKSCADGLPVRVVRGVGGHPVHSPATGYRYDGLYFVESYWQEVGRAGFRIWRYRLVKELQSDTPALASPPIGESTADGPARRVTIEVQRLVRNTPVAQRVKQLHDYRCQVCGERIVTTAGPYAEGAHIRPLGRPHDGPDVQENILCLCPNDHVRFDYGDLLILDDLGIINGTGEACGTLRTAPGHVIALEHLAYHRQRFRPDQ
jgi:putative restriction endonuclease